MSKSFDIVMAGLISGIVALTTTFLGVGGTVIGAVLGAILYQIFSVFIKEPLENVNVKKVERAIVYSIPLILIATFLAFFIVALLHSYSFYYSEFLEFFKQLEEITNNNLVRIMGLGLIVMGIYPLLQPKTIQKGHGLTILILGIILLVRGLLDINHNILYFYTEVFGFFDIAVNIIIFLILVFIIIKILLESISLYINRNKDISIDEYRNPEITKNQAYIRNDSRFKSKTNNRKDNDAKLGSNNEINYIPRSKNEIQQINKNIKYNNINDISVSDSNDFSITDNSDNENFNSKKSPFINKTIKSNKNSTMPQNRKKKFKKRPFINKTIKSNKNSTMPQNRKKNLKKQ